MEILEQLRQKIEAMRDEHIKKLPIATGKESHGKVFSDGRQYGIVAGINRVLKLIDAEKLSGAGK